MTTERARELLGVGEDTNADKRREVFDSKRAVLESKLATAATSGLKLKYEQAIRELEQAYEALELADPASALQNFSLRPEPNVPPPGPAINAEKVPAPRKGLPLPVKLAFGAVLVAGLLALAWPEIRSRWDARQSNEKALQALGRSDWRQALELSYATKQMRPADTEYNTTYTRAVGSFIEYKRNQLASSAPLDALAQVQDISKNLPEQLGNEGQNKLREIFRPLESGVIDEFGKAFDVDLAAVNKVAGNLTTDSIELFSPESRTVIKQMAAGGKILGDAQHTWDEGRPGDTAKALRLVPQNLQKKIYRELHGKVDGLLAEINDKVKRANLLVRSTDYMAVKSIYDSIKPNESWIDGLEAARMQANDAGEIYFHQKLLEAVAAKQPAEATAWFKKLREYQSQSIDGSAISSLFQPQTTAQFLHALTVLNLHPGSEESRRDYGDVVLVAANQGNLTDAPEAERFLAEYYLQWAGAEGKKGHLEQACYLALLAQKHGSTSADEPFARWQAAIVAKYPVVLDIETLKTTPAKGRDFSDTLFVSSLEMLRKVVPAFVKVSDPDNPLESAPGAIRLKLIMGVSEFSSSQENVQRNESRVVKVNVLVHNPDYDAAVAAVDSASQSVNLENDNIRQTSQVTSMGSQLPGMTGALSGVFAQTTSGIQSNNLAEMQNTLNEASQTLARTPQQVSQVQDQTISWPEVDHLTKFHTVYKMDLKAGALSPTEHPFEARVVSKSTERRGLPQFGVDPIEREAPDLDQVTAALSNQLSAQFGPYFSSPFFSTLKKIIGQQFMANARAEGVDVVTLRTTLLWWNTPWRNLPRTADSLFKARYGDSIPVDTPTSRGSLMVTSLPLGAQVFVGSESKGFTPLSVADVPTGMLKVAVGALGYRVVVRDVEVNPNECSEVNASLNREYGQLAVTSLPAEVEADYVIDLNGLERTHLTGKLPAKLDSLPTGKYSLTVQARGFSTVRKIVDVSADKANAETIALEKALATINITASVPNAEVFLDGVKMGTAPLSIDKLNPGSYKLLLKANDRDDQELNVAASPDEVKHVRVQFGDDRKSALLKRFQGNWHFKFLGGAINLSILPDGALEEEARTEAAFQLNRIVPEEQTIYYYLIKTGWGNLSRENWKEYAARLKSDNSFDFVELKKEGNTYKDGTTRICTR
jgi:predicted transcriptional regulator